ncbi:MAG: hypothetical protein U0704_04070 [Candidatus Eisenbacteria bacterium]
MKARVFAMLCACTALVAAHARADSLEPPPEATADDYTLERADTLAEGTVETSWSADGRPGAAPRRGQRLRFRSAGANASVREGADPLAGGSLDATVRGGRLRVGRLAPRWGQGLVLGGAAEPWARAADDRGEGAAYRGRSGDGAAFEPDGAGLGAFAGRFQKRRLAGAHAAAGACEFGALAAGTSRQCSGALAGDVFALEAAGDARGRWRAEAAARMEQGATAFAWRVRAGHAAFRSLAEPRRSGPARALALTAAREGERAGVVAHGALWAFGPGADGSRGALEVHCALVHHAAVVFGIEEQHGTRRDPALFAASAAGSGMRQGWWCEWRGSRDGRELALRHELWGERAFARAALRRVLVARGGMPLPFGGAIALQHAVWAARSGEKLWLPEAGDDRLTLRALGGSGARSRLELEAPALGGRVRAGVGWMQGGSRPVPPQWTLEWIRRTRL